MNRYRIALLLLGASAFGGIGCEIVAGIQDLQVADGGSGGGEASASGSGQSTSSTSSSATTGGTSNGTTAGSSSGTSSGEQGDTGTGTTTSSSGGTSSGEVDGSPSSSGGTDGGHEASSSTSSGTSSGASSSGVLIDDMESMNGVLDGTAPGLTGNWFEYNDGTGTQNPAPMGTGKVLFPTKLASPATLGGVSTSYVTSTNGSGFTTWGAGIGFNFKSGGGAYNVSAYSGFLFYAEVASGAITTFRFDVPTQGTSTTGGVCNPSGTCGGASPTCCGDHYGYNVTGLSTSWKQITIPFADLAQQGYGMPVSFDETEVYGCDFQVEEDTTFNFSIADVYFTTP